VLSCSLALTPHSLSLLVSAHFRIALQREKTAFRKKVLFWRVPPHQIKK
jgi:hypothetical protein